MTTTLKPARLAPPDQGGSEQPKQSQILLKLLDESEVEKGGENPKAEVAVIERPAPSPRVRRHPRPFSYD